MPIGSFIFTNVWLLFILAVVLDAFYLRTRSKKFIQQRPELQEGYDRIFKGYLVYLNLPWLVMGTGIVLGRVPGFVSFFRPRDGNPFVLAFHATLVALGILGIWWIYFRGGAEFLVKYPGVFNRDDQSPTFVKFFFGFALLVGITAMIIMWRL